MLTRLLRVLLVTVLIGLGSVVAAPSAPACACGAAPMAEADTRVTGEEAFVVLDGRTQRTDLVMRLSGSTRDAGWIMPTPQGTELALGDRDAITRLAEATKPVTVTKKDWTPRFMFGGSAGSAGAAPESTARVEKVTDIGPFRVTTLTGTRASAVNDWLRDNAYATRDELLPTFQSYLDQGWRVQAVRLKPESAQFAGELPAFRMMFTTDEAVYPIKLSSHARIQQSVRLFVAADHRMDVRTQAAPSAPLTLRFAGPLDPDVTGLDRRRYVTAYQGSLAPSTIENDFTFAPASSDRTYMKENVVWDRSPGEAIGTILFLGFLVVVVALPFVLVTGLVVVIVRAVGRRR